MAKKDKKAKDDSPSQYQRTEADEEARKEAIRLMEEARVRAAKEAEKGEPEEEEPKDKKGKKATKSKPKKKQKVFDDNGVPMLGLVKVYSPFKTYFDGPAYSVSALNGTGVFDVLPGHKNFLSLLLPYEVVIHGKRGEDRLKIERGIMHVADDEVIIFLDV